MANDMHNVEFRSLLDKYNINRVLLPPILIYPNSVTTNIPTWPDRRYYNSPDYSERIYHSIMKDLNIPYVSNTLDDIKLIPEVAADLAGDKEPNLEMYTRAVLNAYIQQET
jgi:hypothetical protein